MILCCDLPVFVLLVGSDCGTLEGTLGKVNLKGVGRKEDERKVVTILLFLCLLILFRFVVKLKVRLKLN